MLSAPGSGVTSTFLTTVSGRLAIAEGVVPRPPSSASSRFFAPAIVKPSS